MNKLQKIFFSRSSKHKFPITLIIGAPGVGKGTYSRMLSKELKIKEFSTGDELRRILSTEDNTPEMKQIKDILSQGNILTNKGKLVKDEYMIDLVKKKLDSIENVKGVILDGYPRTLNQAIQFDDICKIDLVINITLNNEILMRKLLGRRICKNCGNNYNICSINEVFII